MVILQPPKLAAFEPLLCGLQDRQRRVCARACVRVCVCHNEEKCQKNGKNDKQYRQNFK